ncbi:hypothetical protein CONLIGDRAFT_684181 [Coniochaeta ligniaria NRRL 30616]|uniref:ABM domain-containing protein n=1 Tax=Coniochaeta ligniaria NRRL 30616 TaxID=1408157 RepID=A0A1J7JDH5_9PEZI|nr:hypothetical protein CONLIGDRAFT_684181 [Coniochaeta ligniaria NRRL 30616]
MAGPSSSVSVNVKITINPSYTEAFLAALKTTMDAIVAEPLNTFFEVYQHPTEPGVFKLAENWDATAEYLNDVQLKKEYYKPYYATITPMLIKAPEVELFDRMGGGWVSVRKDSYPGRE